MSRILAIALVFCVTAIFLLSRSPSVLSEIDRKQVRDASPQQSKRKSSRSSNFIQRQSSNNETSNCTQQPQSTGCTQRQTAAEASGDSGEDSDTGSSRWALEQIAQERTLDQTRKERAELIAQLAAEQQWSRKQTTMVRKTMNLFEKRKRQIAKEQDSESLSITEATRQLATIQAVQRDSIEKLIGTEATKQLLSNSR